MSTTITGSKGSDLLVFGLLFAVLIVSSPRLRVYYKSTPTEVSLHVVNPNGSKQMLPTPQRFQGTQPGIFWTERQIKEFSKTQEAKDLTSPGAQLEWALEYTINSPPYKATRTLITNTPNE